MSCNKLLLHKLYCFCSTGWVECISFELDDVISVVVAVVVVNSDSALIW